MSLYMCVYLSVCFCVWVATDVKHYWICLYQALYLIQCQEADVGPVQFKMTECDV